MFPTKLLLTLTGLLCVFVSRAQILSSEATISVLTLGPDQSELYSAFGHSGIRVHDPNNDWDILYDYGVFDFDQPNFYLNFARGKLYYKLGIHRYERFRDYYIRNNRTIIEQTLNLDSMERQKLFKFLQWNAHPDNQYYYYNYIYDNCATKIRDVFDLVFDNRIDYDTSYVQEDLSFRDLMDIYLPEQPWGDLGIDICLGTGIDKRASGYHYMYLPDYIEKALDGAVMKTDSGTKKLVSQKATINTSDPEPSAASVIDPRITFIAVFLIFGFISFQEVKKGKRSNGIDVVLLSVTGIVGWLLLFLWFLTDHISQNNFNLLWALPFHFPVALLLLKEQKPAWLKNYFLVVAVVLAILIAFWGFWPQNLHDSLIPLVLLILIRAVLIRRDLVAQAGE